MLQQISAQDAGQLFCISSSDFELHGEASLAQLQMQMCQLDLPGRSELVTWFAGVFASIGTTEGTFWQS